ncbi:hypothetical protein H310_09778 [Aphanomyces invadans]|uniref:Uncharacterized protein n=1 Tax=Aphanomyces invadans TaxID=157072 RepID=A0A024TSD4_9STRA|nr:hypothetical protein H310_09778 [Aphanomyces invadans]ETV96913.1 hypothetical protein H310_09778 [Aphanomyces invadans]|eukprot:XP_008874159.1 hypothetical protein H310_09778 [Aphanomyces invadans]
MSAQLVKLNSILFDSNDTKVLGSNSDVIGADFDVVPNPTILDKLKLHRSHMASFFVRIDTGAVSLTQNGFATSVAPCDLHLDAAGKKEVRVKGPQSPEFVPYTFDSPLLAAEFVGAIHLNQHIHALRNKVCVCACPAHDMVLLEHVTNTVWYADQMWTLALWNHLFPYSNMLELLESAGGLLRHGHAHDAKVIFEDLHDQFFSHAAVNKMGTSDGQKYYRPSQIALFVAKLRALCVHCANYTNFK